MRKNINLNKEFNKNTSNVCDKCDRKLDDNIVNSLCKLVMGIDGEKIRCVGNWAYQKIYYITRYFDIFTVGMKNKWNINYIEICSGPGRCIYRNESNEYDGTALSILQHEAYKHIKNILFFDKENEVVRILNKRINNLKKNKAKAFIADYANPSTIIDTIENCSIDLSNSLNLVVIDPTDCSVPFETIKKIKNKLVKMDLIINFAYGTDLNRNIVKLVKGELKSAEDKYISFLGSDDFINNKQCKKLAEQNKNDKLLEIYLENYKENLKKIGLRFIGTSQPIKHYYTLLFASENKRGLDFWNKITKKEYSGQKMLDL